MKNPDSPERTAGGPLGRLAGKAKQLVGSALGEEDLAREGRLQEARVDADADAQRAAEEARLSEEHSELEAQKVEAEAERERLQAEVDAKRREEEIERERQETERRAAEEALQNQRAAEADRNAEAAAAAEIARRGESELVAGARTATALEQEAERAEARADAIDPEEQS